MRRDVSTLRWLRITALRSSLHAQRCFWFQVKICQDIKVFSACAEMFPWSHRPFLRSFCLLCMRRDVSYDESQIIAHRASSLHAQRCFCRFKDYCITSDGLLCMRRDVSDLVAQRQCCITSSLHAQRCFLKYTTLNMWCQVFSACASSYAWNQSLSTMLKENNWNMYYIIP